MKNDSASDVSRDCAWVPKDFSITHSTVASVIVMSLEAGIAVRLTEYESTPGVRAWMRNWFLQRREEFQRSRPSELAEPTGMISLTVGQTEHGLALEEARVASYPAVPEAWPARQHRDLIDRAIAFLT